MLFRAAWISYHIYSSWNALHSPLRRLTHHSLSKQAYCVLVGWVMNSSLIQEPANNPLGCIFYTHLVFPLPLSRSRFCGLRVDEIRKHTYIAPWERLHVHCRAVRCMHYPNFTANQRVTCTVQGSRHQLDWKIEVVSTTASSIAHGLFREFWALVCICTSTAIFRRTLLMADPT